MLSFLKRLKFTYSIYNFFHKKQLGYNEKQYKKLGIKKKYYSSISSNDFKAVDNHFGLTGDDNFIKNRLKASAAFNNLDAYNQESLLQFSQNGFAILKHYFSTQQIDEVNKEIDTLLRTGTIKMLPNHKIMFAYKQSQLLKNMGNEPALKELLATLFGEHAILFQSINFLHGSEQHTHSDSIHMTTFPTGGLLGVWIALEDISDDNGPLHYYPSSHQLPYYMNGDYNNAGNKWMLGNKSYKAYEKMIEEKIKEYNITKQIFYAEKGDVLIWHANLFHGGEPHINKNKTRKSMVLHYFREGDICYHEITQRPALMNVED